MCGRTADVATVRATLDGIAGPKILVEHSYGGYVVTNVASGRTDVQALVYTAAFTPDEGDTLQSLGVGYAPPAAFEHLVWTGEPFTSLAYLDPVWFRHDFAQDVNPKAAAEMSAHQQPIAVPILTTPSGPAAWHTIPSHRLKFAQEQLNYMVTGEDAIAYLQRAYQQFLPSRPEDGEQ